MKFVGIEPVGATLFPEKLAAFPDLVEIAKTNPACCRVSETTSMSTPVGLAISGWRLKSVPAALWWLLGRHLDLGRGMQGRTVTLVWRLRSR